MATSRTPASKKTTTTKKTASSAVLPASTAKAAPKPRAQTATAAAPKARAKTPAAATPKPARPKQEKLTLEAAVTSKPRATKKAPVIKTVAPEERYQMIAAAAYFLAERHGFSRGRALDDWIAAEKEIDSMLKS